MVFYRKYRPQKIAEIDITEVREKLTGILLSESIPHALLFTGPKGLGKTSAARILAKVINCRISDTGYRMPDAKAQSKVKSESKENKSIEPCNECEVCLSITSGSNIDVIEIDAASNRGVDEIRTLRETIRFSPVALPRKIYIIDEVHMLTTEAFNALLKTLEEPPDHALFILCTTEEWRLPQTIISRTFSIRFGKPNKEELIRSVKRILTGEKLEIDQELFDLIYSLSDGSFRDAAKIIEELSFAAKDKKISKELLETLYNSNFIEGEVVNFILALAKKDLKAAFTVLEKISQKGSDFKIVTEKIIDYLRKILLKKNGFANEVIDIETDADSLIRLIGYFEKAYREIKDTPIASLPLELAAAKWSLENLKLNPAAGGQNSKLKKDDDLELPTERNFKPAAAEKNNKTQAISLPTLNTPKEKLFFDTLISEVKQDNHSVAGLLRGAKLIELSENEFKLEVSYKFHSERLNENKIRQIIENRASKILKQDMKMLIISKLRNEVKQE